MRKMLRLLQAALLIAALAVTGTAFMPSDAHATDPEYLCATQTYCDGGSYPCGRVWDPDTQTFVRCTLSCV